MQVPIKFYAKFFEEFEALPLEVQDSLTSYLERLEKNPDSSELHTENYGPDHFVHIFHPQYLVYCHLERASSAFVGLLGQIARIEVLSIDPVSRVLPRRW
jgi:hypothetical protein